jgi:predicted NBD/HSP70 family sugar kinase
MPRFVHQSKEVGEVLPPVLRSLSEILGMVADGRVHSRTDIARLSGLARSTVTARVGVLMEEGLLVEDELGPSSGGRPPVGLRLNPVAGLTLGADIGATHLRVALADLAGKGIEEEAGELLIDAGPDAVLSRVKEVMLQLLARTGHRPEAVRGIGIGVPGPVQFRTGTVIRPPIMPGWDGVCLPDHFADTFSAPVLVDNDVNLMALGEHGARGSVPELMLFIRIGSGIGCGIIDDSRVHRGADGAAGDIGHIQLSDVGDTLCRCGNTGCIEAVASGSAMARQLTEAGLPCHSSADVVALAQSGSAQAKQVVRQASERIGSVVATLVNCYNPSTIIIGGPLSPLRDDLLASIRSVVYRRATPLATRSLVIESSRLDERAGVIGALALIRGHLFSADGLSSLFGKQR